MLGVRRDHRRLAGVRAWVRVAPSSVRCGLPGGQGPWSPANGTIAGSAQVGGVEGSRGRGARRGGGGGAGRPTGGERLAGGEPVGAVVTGRGREGEDGGVMV